LESRASNLLLVDDDPAILQMLMRRLGAVGFDVTGVGSGEQALDVLENKRVDLVVSDLNMPGIGGFALLAAIRQRYTPSALPVVILSARGDSEDVINALRLGANDYATKPVRFEELQSRIEAHLALKAVDRQVVPGYQLVRCVGEGGMGVVCEAVEIASGRSVALKVMHRSLTTDETVVQRFVREAQLSARIEHPNVVRTYRAGIDGGTYYIVMELVRGLDLATMQHNRPLEVSAALGIARQVVLALQAMAGVGIVHRDIKPENVIVANDGMVKVADFGIAHDLWDKSRLTKTGRGLGTVAYSSPEQMYGQAEVGTDIYGVGCVLFFMVTGQDPFEERQPVDQLWRKKNGNPRKVTAKFPDLYPPVARLIECMIEPKPMHRPTTTECLDAIEAILSGESPRLPKHFRFGPAYWAAAVAVVVLAIGLGILLTW